MSAPYVRIANLALSHLGDDATVASLDPPEGSEQAEHCAMWLPIARDTLLEMHNWGFATRRVQPALLHTGYGPWGYAYERPADCIRVLGVYPDGYIRRAEAGAEFDWETDENAVQLILTDTENATIVYTRRVDDPSKFTPLFTESLAWLLASYVAGPLIKGTEGQQAAQAAYGAFLAMFARATGSSANQAKLKIERDAPWMAARA